MSKSISKMILEARSIAEMAGGMNRDSITAAPTALVSIALSLSLIAQILNERLPRIPPKPPVDTGTPEPSTPDE